MKKQPCVKVIIDEFGRRKWSWLQPFGRGLQRGDLFWLHESADSIMKDYIYFSRTLKLNCFIVVTLTMEYIKECVYLQIHLDGTVYMLAVFVGKEAICTAVSIHAMVQAATHQYTPAIGLDDKHQHTHSVRCLRYPQVVPRIGCCSWCGCI